MNQLIINTNNVNDQKKQVIYTFIDLTIIQIYLLGAKSDVANPF